MSAASVAYCSLLWVDWRVPRRPNAPSRSRPCVVCQRRTSRSPIRREAKCEVPPFSPPEHRRINVLLQFSTTGPIVGTDPRVYHQLIALACILGERLAERTEGD